MQHRVQIAAILIGLISLGSALCGCTSHHAQTDYGIQSDTAAFVPARIAIMPCASWPATANWPGRTGIGINDTELSKFCQRLDQFVQDGFSNQPFMRGNSRRFVQKTLTDAGMIARLDEIPRLWAQANAERCNNCQTPPAYYRQVVSQKPAWLAWLAELSSQLKNADAFLLPYVNMAYERTYDDRGLNVAERGLGVVLLLIDTANGELIWAGGRHTVVPHKRLDATRRAEPLAYPDWSLAEERVMTSELWRDFPGRLTQ